MRLVKIGRDPRNNIVINNPRVSAVHAELILLDNGDILIEDKGSSNGTMVNGQAVIPGRATTIRRGDNVSFAGEPLNWSSVPQPEDLSGFKAVYSLGTNFRNDVKLNGDRVSRFHATLKQANDGKWYIHDHSKNGTMVNGQRIPSGIDVRIKKGDTVSCAGQVVDLSRYMGGRSGGSGGSGGGFTKILIAVAAAVVVVGIAVGAWFLLKPKADPGKATVCVFHSFHFVVTLDDDPFIEVMKENGITGWPDKYEFGVDPETGEVGPMGNTASLVGMNPNRFQEIPLTGTAFFVSDNGIMLTNRHVAKPWIYSDLQSKVRACMGEIQQKLPKRNISLIYDLYRANPKYNDATVSNWFTKYESSAMKISGETDFLSVGQSYRMYNSLSELMPATVLLDSNDDNIDVAVMQLNTVQTPKNITDHIINMNKALTDPNKLVPGKSEFTYWGYPLGTYLNLDSKKSCGLTPQVYHISLSRVPGQYDMELQGQVLSGASGSPIIDKDGRLVGIINSSMPGTTISNGVLAKYAVELYNQAREQKRQ